MFFCAQRNSSSVSSSVKLGIIRMSTVCSHFPSPLLVMNTRGRLLLLLLSGLRRALSTGGYVRNEPGLSVPLFLPLPVLPDFRAKSLRQRLFTLCWAGACTNARTHTETHTERIVRWHRHNPAVHSTSEIWQFVSRSAASNMGANYNLESIHALARTHTHFL